MFPITDDNTEIPMVRCLAQGGTESELKLEARVSDSTSEFLAFGYVVSWSLRKE